MRDSKDKMNAAAELGQSKLKLWLLLIPAFFFLFLAFLYIYPQSFALPKNNGIAALFLLIGLTCIFAYLKYSKIQILLASLSGIFSIFILLQEMHLFASFTPTDEWVTPVGAICFLLIALSLVIFPCKQFFPWNIAAIVASGSFIFAIAGFAFIDEIYGIGRAANLFQIDLLLTLGFALTGTTFIASTWKVLSDYIPEKNISWYMMPANICIITGALAYIVLLIAYPSFQHNPAIRPEEVLTIALLAGIVYYLRQTHQRSKELEQTIIQLNNARDSLINQEKFASLGVLVAGIAHEIKNPLNYIYNFSDLCSNMLGDLKKMIDSHQDKFSSKETHELQEYFHNISSNLTSINKQSARANNTVQHMLLHARSQTDEMALTDLHGLLDEYLTLSYQGLKVREPDFTIKIEKAYAPTGGKVRVHAEGMSRVFLNIFNNAYYALLSKKKRDKASYSPILSIKTALLNNIFEIRIKDNGDGIPTDIEKKIFTPFFTTKSTGEGTGLGLSLSRNIVENEHSGSLTFQSQEGNFTEFIIKLPAKNNQDIHN